MAAVLNNEEIGKHTERITKTKPFINKYKWREINGKKWLKELGKTCITIAPKRKKYPAHVSKQNSNREKQVTPLIIANKEKHETKPEGWRRWHYLAVKKISALLRGVKSKNNGDLYCLNCLHYFRTENKLESNKIVSQDKDFGNIMMPSEDSKILKFN